MGNPLLGGVPEGRGGVPEGRGGLDLRSQTSLLDRRLTTRKLRWVAGGGGRVRFEVVCSIEYF